MLLSSKGFISLRSHFGPTSFMPYPAFHIAKLARKPKKIHGEKLEAVVPKSLGRTDRQGKKLNVKTLKSFSRLKD